MDDSGFVVVPVGAPSGVSCDASFEPSDDGVAAVSSDLLPDSSSFFFFPSFEEELIHRFCRPRRKAALVGDMDTDMYEETGTLTDRKGVDVEIALRSTVNTVGSSRLEKLSVA
jgi:hypothetical protein